MATEPMGGTEIVEAIMARVDQDDDTALATLIEQIREGQVVVTATNGNVTLTPLSNDPRRRLGRHLLALQKQGTITQSQLAVTLDVHPNTVLRYLNGHSLPSWFMICRMVEALGGDPRAFLPLWDEARAMDRRFRERKVE